MSRVALAWRVGLSTLVMSLGSVVMLAVATLTLFRARRFYSESIATPLGRLILKIWGIRLRVRHEADVPAGQVVYISNHTSTIDLFALIALGLPDTRFFLSGYLRWVLPMGLIGYLIGIFWTVPQSHPERRRRIFRRAAETLRRSGASVYLSPEGRRVTSGDIGAFNKGAFHLAASLGAPIVPIFIAIPTEIDPGRGLAAKSGLVDIVFKPAIATTDWRIEHLLEHRDAVRQQYVEWNGLHRGGTPA